MMIRSIIILLLVTFFTSAHSQEVCADGLDNDNNGLVDLFDPDCPCNQTAYQAQCETNCNIESVNFKIKEKWRVETPDFFFFENIYLSGDVDSDGSIEVVYLSLEASAIIILEGATGLVKDSIYLTDFDENLWPPAGFLSMADIDKDGKAEFFISYAPSTDQLWAQSYSLDGSHLWTSIDLFDFTRVGIRSMANLFDLNADGQIEYLIGNIVLNAHNGKLLAYGKAGSGCTPDGGANSCGGIMSYGFDIDPTLDGQELIAGNTIYQFIYTNPLDTFGNELIVLDNIISEDYDGLSAVADFNADGHAEIVGIFRSTIGDLDRHLVIYDYFNKVILDQIITNDFFYGMPAIGDVDGDCIPEIISVSTNHINVYNFTNGSLNILIEIPIDNAAARNGITLFDFDQDGTQELIDADHDFLRIIDGDTGITLDSFAEGTQTSHEYYNVSDIDLDGHAEIIVFDERNVILCLESQDDNWAPARSVWNQYAYNPTFINDDLTIPQFPQNPAQSLEGWENCDNYSCPTPYNNFMTQATFRTQEGCFVSADQRIDLSISASSICRGDSIEICLFTNSMDSIILSQGIPVVIYPPELMTGTNGVWIDSLTIYSDTTCLMYPSLMYDSLYIFINDGELIFPPVFPNTAITECDYIDNEYILQLGGPDFNIDIIDYECSPDSLILYIALNNLGVQTEIECIEGGCYFENPITALIEGMPLNPIEITSWCFDFDGNSMAYQYLDTFRVSIPIPVGQTQMWWTVNEGGFGPGLLSSELTEIYECNYLNNIDSLSFDVDAKTLEIGLDFDKCQTEIFNLNAGADFESYLWNDLSTDSIYTSLNGGLHFIEATDQCGRVYFDTVTVNILINDTIQIAEQICDSDSLFFDGHYLNTPGLYQMTTQNLNGCDSTTFLNLEIVNELLQIDTLQVCQNDSLLIFGNWIFNDTLLQQTFVASSGCDSIQSYIVLEEILPVKSRVEELCFKDSILINGIWFLDEGNYELQITNPTGCDSLVYLEIISLQLSETYDTLNACQGDTISVFSISYTEDEDIFETYSAANGCDSTSYYHLEFVEIVETLEELILCPGDSILINGAWIKSEGLYPTLYTSVIGCDSINYVDVTFVEDPPSPITEINCQELEISLSIDAQSVWHPLWSNGDTSNFTTYSGSVIEAGLTLHTQPNCEKNLTITLPSLPDIEAIPFLDDTTILHGQALMIDLNLNTNEWSVQWLNEQVVDCDTCMNVIITPSIESEITIYLEHISGCTFETSFIVKFEETDENIYVPNIFSPNNDNNNDTWTVFATGNIQFSESYIYDRWGNLVYSSLSGQPQWNGNMKGKKCIEGVYVYKINYVDSEGNSSFKAGDITLIR